MRNRSLSLLLLIISTGVISAQLSGKIVIRNASDTYPKFVASMNGVRVDNTYTTSVTFDYLDDNIFRLKIFQYGIAKPLTFAVNTEANYITRYLITRDESGFFKSELESKIRINANGEQSSTVAATGTTVVLTAAAPEKINDKDLSDMLAAIKKESFENSKLDLARNFFSTQYHSSEQVLDVLKLFSFENNKVSFAKYAYAKTIDKQNYYKVYDGFSFAKSKQEVSEYIQKNP